MRGLKVLAPVVALVLLNGCIVLNRKVEFAGERQSVSFASTQAAKIFHDSMNRPKLYHSDIRYTIIVPAGVVEFNQVLHEVEFYNAQVRHADANRDGIITEEEAQLLVRPKEEGEE